MTDLADDPYMTPAEVAVRLRMTEGGLRWWRHVGRGPRSSKNGRRTLYRTSAVDAWERRNDAETGRGETPQAQAS